MQGVKAWIGLAVPVGRSVLVAEDRSVAGVATLEQRAGLYWAGRPDVSTICRIALVSKETVVVSVQLQELRQVLRGSIP
jgi:hypothetical protein